MRKIFKKKYLDVYIVDAIITLVCISLGLAFINEIEQISSFAWIALAVVVVAIFALLGNEKIEINHSLPFAVKKRIGLNRSSDDESEGQFTTKEWFLRIIKLQIGFLITLWGLFFIATPGVLASASSQIPAASFMVEFIRHEMALTMFYPFLLTAIFITFSAVIARNHIPKMSSALEVMFNRKLGSLPASVADFCVLLGLLVGMLVVASLMGIFLGQLIGYYFNIDMSYGLTVRTSAIGFTLVYLPFTAPWKDIMSAASKSVMFSFPTLLILIGIGLGIYLVIATCTVDWLLRLLDLDPYRSIIPLIHFNTTPDQTLKLMLFIVSFFVSPVIAVYIALISKGRSLRNIFVAMLFVPCLIVGLNLLVPASSNLFIEKTLTLLFTKPYFEIIAITVCLTIFIPWRNNTGLQEGLLLILPNEFNWKKAGRKRRRLRNFIKYSSSFIVYAMVTWVYMGIMGVQRFSMPFLVLALAVMFVGIVGFIRYILVNKVLPLRINSESKEHV
jgi:hypothetical protein